MKNKWAVGVVLVVMSLSAWIGISEAMVHDISEGVLRLHIIANSDKKEDQELKLKIRDEVLKTVRENIDINFDKEYIQNHGDDILAICRRVIEENQFTYPVKLEVGNFYFPTKSYKNIALPAGNYDAVKIVIGDGEGENWWCVMYPPLCFTAETKGKLSPGDFDRLKESMKEEAFELISGNEQDVIILRPSFKIVETWQTMKRKMQKAG